MAGKMFVFHALVCIFSVCQVVYGVNYQPKAISLSEDNWSDILHGEWMVEFMAPWCPACRSFTETWNTFANKWSRDLDVQVAVIDVTENPGLSGRFLISALPSIYHVKDGAFRQYMGSRSENDLVSFLDDKKWQDLEPVSKWTSPDSIQMSLVAQFFKLAMRIRSFYTLMTEEYGIPEWGCYAIFAVITILLGLLLGLLLVCICDFVMPAKQIPPPIPAEMMAPAMDKEGDIIDDTLDASDSENAVRKRNVKQADDGTADDSDEEGDTVAKGDNQSKPGKKDESKETKKDN